MGRPPKDRSDLTEAYRRVKESAEHRAQAKGEHGDGWVPVHRAWLAERRAREAKGRARAAGRVVWAQPSIEGSLVRMAPREARQLMEELAERRRVRVERLAQQEVAGVAQREGQRVVAGCSNQAMVGTPGCRMNVLRCVDHAGISCWGGWRGCECMIEERRPLGVPRVTWLRQRQQNTETYVTEQVKT